MKYKTGIVFLTLGWLCIGHSAIFTWTDNNGVVHFSDQPAPGAKEVQLPNGPATVPSSTLPPVSSSVGNKTTSTVIKTNTDGKVVAEKPTTYESLVILEPKDNDTIRNPQGFIPVTVEVKPALQEGDMLQLLLDGNVMGPPQSSRSFSLTGLDRGEHTFQVQAVNQKGEELISSEKVTIFLMPPRVNMGNS